MAMIKRSVEQRPDDGYIVDSLGWAYYRIGNYDEAVKNLERAVELKPVDPTINDHLGDAYWKVDRALEAKFQWSHARDLKPDPDELEKIEEKLKVGLAGRYDEPAGRCRRRQAEARRPATADEPAGAAPCAEPVLAALAPAKINLTLRILGRRADGYHDLESLVAFAPFGDRLTFHPGAPARAAVSRPDRRAAPAPPVDNLELRAARALGGAR